MRLHLDRWKTFLGPLAPARLTPVDAGLMDALLQRALATEGVRVDSDAAMAAYQDPEQPGFVLFARAEQGRLRVKLQPSVAQGLPFDLTAQSKATNAELAFGLLESTEDAATFVVDAAPGEYTVILTAPDYEPVAPVEASAVGGKVADLPAIAMQLLPNGILELTILDLTGTNVAARVSRVTATSADGSVTRRGPRLATVEPRGKWPICRPLATPLRSSPPGSRA